MIIKKLKSASGGKFPGAEYNEKKVMEGIAELIGAFNIDGEFLHNLKLCQDRGLDCGNMVEHYLQSRSQTFGNTKSTRWQLHIVLSCKGHEKTKEQLRDIAKGVMRKFDYGEQPYFIYFHHDTDNNHVHILTTRVTKIGSLKKDHNDYRKLSAALNSVLHEDLKKDFGRILSYNFTTEGQLLNIARDFHYDIGESKANPDRMVFYYAGAPAFEISRAELEEVLAKKTGNPMRQKERTDAAHRLKAILIRYRGLSLKQKPVISETKKTEHAKTKKELVVEKPNSDVKHLFHADGTPLTVEEQYQMNWFLNQIHNKLGIAVHFQKDKNGVIRGYSVIDHNNKAAVNGSEIVKLSDLIDFAAYKKVLHEKASQEELKTKPVARVWHRDSSLDIYRPLFQARVGRVVSSGKPVVVMKTSDGEFTHELTVEQLNSFASAEEQARDDIAIRLAVYYFHQRIYDSYIKMLANEYVDKRRQNFPMDKVRLYKKKDGRWILAVDYPGNTVKFMLTNEECLQANTVAFHPCSR